MLYNSMDCRENVCATYCSYGVIRSSPVYFIIDIHFNVVNPSNEILLLYICYQLLSSTLLINTKFYFKSAVVLKNFQQI